MKRVARILVCVCMVATVGLGAAGVKAAESPPGTPEPFVAAYNSLADTILGAKKTEWNLVHAILATTYSHAEATMGQAKAKLKAGQDARAEIEKLAAMVAELANEGDAAIAAVRKRLLEGGHHHNAQGEQQGIYDEGFVIVTRKAKKALLDAANTIGKLSGAPDAKALDAAWKKVEKEFSELHRDVPGVN